MQATIKRPKREKPEPVQEKPFTAADRQAFVDAIFKINVNRWESHRSDFQRRLESGSASNAITSCCEGVFTADNVLPMLRGWWSFITLGWFGQEKESDARTWEQMIVEVEKQIAEQTRRLIEYDDYRHNCTSAIVNIENQCKFRARQAFVGVMTEVLSVMKRPVEVDAA